MDVVITNEARDVLLTEPAALDFKNLRSTAIIEDKQQLNLSFGTAVMEESHFDGISIVRCQADVYENIYIHVNDVPQRVMLMFMEQGDVSTSIDGFRRDLKLKSLEHNLVYSSATSDNAAVKKQKGITLFALGLTPDRFLELAENNGRVLEGLANHVAGNRSVALAEKFNPRITPRMTRVIEDVRGSGFQGGLKKLFLQSKVIELLALQCEQAEQEQYGPVKEKMVAGDVEKLYYVRDLLIEHIQQPLSLAQLSRKAGLNEFKLKSGFKTVFNNTVFGYLNDRRLEIARELVLEGLLPLSQIAEQAGYSSPQHFSTAFRKKFGVSPGRMRITN